jgi:hypothetical protein
MLEINLRSFVLIVFFLGFNSIIFSQEKRIVTALKLNVRSGASINDNVIDQVKQNDTIIALGQENEWTQIELASGEVGYVSSKYLTEPLSEETFSASDNKNSSPYLTILIIVLITLILTILIIGFKSRCPNCEQWWSKVNDGSKKTGENEEFETVSRYDIHRNNSGKEIGRTERKEQIRVKYVYYENHHSCKKCYYRWKTKSFDRIEL